MTLPCSPVGWKTGLPAESVCFYRTPSLFPALFKGLIWRGPAEKKEDHIVYLTFDDGPVPGPTDFVLEMLNDAGALATFFCIGDNIRKHPETFAAVRDAGHRIGNHTYHHLSGWSVPADQYLENMHECQRWIPASQGKIFRPPFGRIRPDQVRQIRAEGFEIIMWDILSYDFDASLDPAEALKAMHRLTRPGSVVVFHDSQKAMKNLSFILPRYLDFLRSRGYRLEPLPHSFHAC